MSSLQSPQRRRWKRSPPSLRNRITRFSGVQRPAFIPRLQMQPPPRSSPGGLTLRSTCLQTPRPPLPAPAHGLGTRHIGSRRAEPGPAGRAPHLHRGHEAEPRTSPDREGSCVSQAYNLTASRQMLLDQMQTCSGRTTHPRARTLRVRAAVQEPCAQPAFPLGVFWETSGHLRAHRPAGHTRGPTASQPLAEAGRGLRSKLPSLVPLYPMRPHPCAGRAGGEGSLPGPGTGGAPAGA